MGFLGKAAKALGYGDIPVHGVHRGKTRRCFGREGIMHIWFSWLTSRTGLLWELVQASVGPCEQSFDIGTCRGNNGRRMTGSKGNKQLGVDERVPIQA
jgi:hypothetical protein